MISESEHKTITLLGATLAEHLSKIAELFPEGSHITLIAVPATPGARASVMTNGDLEDAIEAIQIAQEAEQAEETQGKMH